MCPVMFCQTGQSQMNAIKKHLVLNRPYPSMTCAMLVEEMKKVVITYHLLCLPALARDCFGVSTEIGRKRRSLRSAVQDVVQVFYAMHQFCSTWC